MSAVEVYRFENAEGLGPWYGCATSAYDGNQEFSEEHSCYDMPGPSSCKERGTALYSFWRTHRTSREYAFGFGAMHQLKRAFPCPKGRAAMKNAGQRLVVYTVPLKDLVPGAAQVVFKRGSGQPIGELDLSTLQPINAEEMAV